MKSVVSTIDQPSRETVLAKLNELVAGLVDREQAAAWASRWLAEDRVPGSEVQVSDFPAWNAVTAIAGADTYGGDRPYLYDEDDFSSWATELAAAPK